MVEMMCGALPPHTEACSLAACTGHTVSNVKHLINIHSALALSSNRISLSAPMQSSPEPLTQHAGPSTPQMQ